MKTTCRTENLNVRGILLSMALVACALLAIGCGDDDESPTGSGGGSSTSPADLVGNWAYSSITADGSSVALDVALDWYANTDEAILSFTAGGGISYVENNGSGSELYREDGTYTLNSGNYMVSMTSSSPDLGYTPYSTSGTWSISGNTLTIRFIESGFDIVASLQKK